MDKKIGVNIVITDGECNIKTIKNISGGIIYGCMSRVNDKQQMIPTPANRYGINKK